MIARLPGMVTDQTPSVTLTDFLSPCGVMLPLVRQCQLQPRRIVSSEDETTRRDPEFRARTAKIQENYCTSPAGSRYPQRGHHLRTLKRLVHAPGRAYVNYLTADNAKHQRTRAENERVIE